MMMDELLAGDFMKTNPGKLRQVSGPPLALMPNISALAVGEYQMKMMIDAALNDLINDGSMASIVKKYNAKGTYVPEPDVRVTH